MLVAVSLFRVGPAPYRLAVEPVIGLVSGHGRVVLRAAGLGGAAPRGRRDVGAHHAHPKPLVHVAAAAAAHRVRAALRQVVQFLLLSLEHEFLATLLQLFLVQFSLPSQLRENQGIRSWARCGESYTLTLALPSSQ